MRKFNSNIRNRKEDQEKESFKRMNLLIFLCVLLLLIAGSGRATKDFPSVPNSVGNSTLIPSVPNSVSNSTLIPSVPNNGNSTLIPSVPNSGNSMLIPSVPNNGNSTLIPSVLNGNSTLIPSVPNGNSTPTPVQTPVQKPVQKPVSGNLPVPTPVPTLRGYVDQSGDDNIPPLDDKTSFIVGGSVFVWLFGCLLCCYYGPRKVDNSDKKTTELLSSVIKV